MTPELLLASVLKTSGIVALALVATALLARRSAAMRHWVLAAALICAAAAPAIERVAPVWRVPSFVATPESLVVSLSNHERAGSSFDKLRNSVEMPSANRLASVALRGERISILSIVRITWLVGAVVSLVILVVGLGRLAGIATRAAEVRRGAWARLGAEVSREYGLARRVRLLQSAHPTLLATWGWWRPCVLLPRGAQSWSEDRIRIVLLHELAHVARGDWAIQVVAEIVRSAYWFNPLVWLAGRRLLQESERAADDVVLNRGIEGKAYASELLTLARVFGRYGRAWAPAPGIARASTLERRVTAMLNVRVNRRPPSRLSKLATALALLAAAVAIASAQAAFSSFSGAVYDPLNGLLPNVKMTLTSEPTGAKYEIRSDSTGRFQFVGLPPGRYALETELMGFKTLRGALDISGQSVQRDVRLEIGSLEETVSVGPPKPGQSASPPVRGMRPMVRTRVDAGTCTAAPSIGGIGGNIRPPTKLVHADPAYPAGLLAAKEGGLVVLAARIGTDGTIREVQSVSSTHPDFEAAATEAVRQWEFSETLLNCVAVEVQMKVTVRFIAE
jgi:TonB family protein